MTVGLAVPLAGSASAATEPGPLAAWDGHPADTREVFPQDGMVLPTDTVVTPPVGDVPPTTDRPAPQQLGFRYVSPGVAYGLLHWWATREGQAAGVTVTYRNRQTGWSYATTTDALGRYRLRVPDGSYDVTYADDRLPDGVWTPASRRVPDSYGYSLWDGGLQQGNFDGVVPRPRFSCVIPAERGSGTDEVVDGAEGWAPGADPATTICPHLASLVGDGPEATQFMIALTTSMASWGLTGRDPLPPAKDAGAAWKIPAPTAAPAAAGRPATAADPRIPSALRASRRGLVSVRVRWTSGASRPGRLALVPSRTRAGRRLATGPVLARGSVRASGRTATLRLTAAGRRATGRGPAAVSVVWTPSGGAAKALSGGRLRGAR